MFTFIAAPVMAQDAQAVWELTNNPPHLNVGGAVMPVPNGPGDQNGPMADDGGHLCGVGGAGGAGGGGCDGVLLEIKIPDSAAGNMAHAPGIHTYTYEVLINIKTGAVWEDTMLAAVDPVANPVVGGRGQTTQDLIDGENAIQHLEALADEAAGAAQKLEIESNTACAGVPLTLRHILCPQLL
jgi:hypothetical protein